MVNDKFFLVCFATLAMTLLASCSEDDATNPQPAATGGINFELTLAPQTRVATGADFKSAWEDGDQVGLFAVKRTSGTPGGLQASDNEIHNIRLTYSNGAWSGVPVWPAGDDYVMDFYAYYPYDASLADPTAAAFAVKADQNSTTGGLSNHSLSDLLTASADNTGEGYANGSTVSLQFAHVMAMVQITVDDTYGAIDTSDEPTATLHSVQTAASFNWTTGVLPAPEGTIDITMCRFPTTDGSLVFRAYLPAQTIAAGATLFSLSVGDNTLEAAPLAADLTMQAGRAELFTQQIPLAVAAAMMTPQPQANSYMVAPGKAILIPISQANRVLTDDGLGAATDGLGGVEATNYTVELVWGDKPVDATGVIAEMFPYGESIYLRTGVAGNAVICVKVGDVVKWSWHIWVTDEVTSATDTGLTWMDRNLGAAGNTWQSGGRNGLYYQWGRKDAFPASDGGYNNQYYYTGSSTNSTTDNPPIGGYTELPGMVQNPLTFAVNATTYCGSLNEEGEGNKSWSGNSGEKTLYDPCPPGWKVPPSGNWGSDTDWGAFGNNGRVFKSGSINQFYPAAGYRPYNTGKVGLVTFMGYYWSATPGSYRDSYRLYFYNSEVSPVHYNFRANGCTIRCIKE